MSHYVNFNLNANKIPFNNSTINACNKLKVLYDDKLKFKSVKKILIIPNGTVENDVLLIAVRVLKLKKETC